MQRPYCITVAVCCAVACFNVCLTLLDEHAPDRLATTPQVAVSISPYVAIVGLAPVAPRHSPGRWAACVICLALGVLDLVVLASAYRDTHDTEWMRRHMGVTFDGCIFGFTFFSAYPAVMLILAAPYVVTHYLLHTSHPCRRPYTIGTASRPQTAGERQCSTKKNRDKLPSPFSRLHSRRRVAGCDSGRVPGCRRGLFA
jgi:hypothetical protein